jgi:hypothetical protein
MTINKYRTKFKDDQYYDIDFSKHLIGFIIFIVVFVILIPLYLNHKKYYSFLELYLPNIDLVATAMSFHEGPMNMWRLLFITNPLTFSAFIYQTIIKYIALLGLTFIVSRETKLTNSIYKGWSIAFIMILITYLLPNNLITYLMTLFNDKLDDFNETGLLCKTCKNTYTLLFGLIFIFMIIMFEKVLLLKLRYYLINISRYIINF